MVPGQFFEDFWERTSIDPHWLHISRFGEFPLVVGFTMSVTCALFQLLIIVFVFRQRVITGTTHLANWLASSIVSYRRLNKYIRCLLRSSGMNICWQITEIFLLLLMESFCPGRGWYRLSIRLGVWVWKRSCNETPVDFWRSALTLCCPL